MKIVKNDLFDYEKRYIYQLEDGFKFSLDSVLLAEYVDIPKDVNKKILDMCTGNAPVPLILSTKTKCKIMAFEIQKPVFQLAVSSVKMNDLQKQIIIYNEDINNIGNIFAKESFDIITCNPPYFKNDIINYNKNDLLTIARHEIKIDLESILKIASDYLKNAGFFYLVHRPERIDDIIVIARKYNLAVKELQLISTKVGANPSLVLVKCRKNGKPGIKIRNEICINGLKTYKNIFNRR